MPRLFPPHDYDGPFFRGVNTQMNPRNLPPGYCADCDNIVVRDGHVTQRPGLSESDGAGHIIGDVLSMRYVSGDVDYAIALTKTKVFFQPWSPDLDPAAWTEAISVRPFLKGSGALYDYGGDTYVSTDLRNYVYRNKLDNAHLSDVGMEAFTTATHAPTCSAVAGGNNDMDGAAVTVYVSRYNSDTDVESDAIECTGSPLDMSAGGKALRVAVTGVVHDDLIGEATHYRIYNGRADGMGYEGLLATIAFDEENQTSFSYDAGVAASGDEGNGGATWAEADDTTNYNYGPCTMNGIPPQADAFCYHDARMYYLTGALLYFSQSVEELQGHVEHVASTSFRSLPAGENGLALQEYRDALFIFSDKQIHRLAGNVNSLTNVQVVLGTDEMDITSSDWLEPVEGTHGCISRDSLIEVDTANGNMILYAGQDNIYRFDGVNSVSIGDAIQNTYLSWVAGLNRHEISAAYYKDLRLVLFAFKDTGIMGWDTATGDWVFWKTFPMDSGNADTIGPCCTRSVHAKGSPGIFLLREKSSTDEDSISLKGSLTAYDDGGNNFAASWEGPYHDGQTAVQKRWDWMRASFLKNGSGGTVGAYSRIDGDSDKPVPATANQMAFPQEHFDEAPVIVRLGYRSNAMQPVFTLAEGYQSKLVGYALEGTRVSP